MNIPTVLTQCLMVDAASCSDRKRAKATFPSGLVSNWQSKASAVPEMSLKAKAFGLNIGNTLALGGLDDEDASATFSPVPTATNRKNDVRFLSDLIPHEERH
jgi:hypothetical protein